MNKKQILIITGISLLLVVILFASLFEFRDVPKLDWTSSNHFDKKEPRDLYVFKELLDEKYGEDNIIIMKDSIELDTNAVDQLFIMIGSRISYSDIKEASIHAFLEAGNQVMLIGKRFDINVEEQTDNLEMDSSEYTNDLIDTDTLDYTDDLIDTDTIGFKEEYYEANLNWQIEFIPDTVFNFDFVGFDSLENKYQYENYNRDLDELRTDWFHVFPEYSDLETIGYASDNKSFFGKASTKSGPIHLHTVPELFHNLGSQQSYYLDHFNKVFAQFDVSSVVLEIADPSTRQYNTNHDKESPLQYVISTPSLAWTYYLLACTLILFVIFKGKRTQKIIPIVEENKNTSLGYVQTLSTLFQEQKQNSKLIKHMRSGFFHRIKRMYFIDHKDEFFISKLAAKSKVDESEITNLVHKLNSTHGAEFTDDQLFILYKQIESFYQKAK